MAGYTIDRQLAEFGEHLRGWRMVLGLTAQQVSERAGITRDTLRKIEAARKRIDATGRDIPLGVDGGVQTHNTLFLQTDAAASRTQGEFRGWPII